MEEQIKKELIGCLKQADLYYGVHMKVYDKGIYSSEMIAKFRKGDRILKVYKMKKLIKAYETELHKIKNKIKKLEIH